MTFLGGLATAVVTWLVIHLLLKPWVDARSEGLTVRRELVGLVVQLSLCASWIAEDLPRDLAPTIQEQIREDRRRNYARMRELTEQLFDQAGEYAAVYRWRHRDMVLRYIMCVRGLMMSRRTQSEQARVVKELGMPMATLLEARLFKVAAIVPAMNEVKRIIELTGVDRWQESGQTAPLPTGRG
ncbi:hypothetical protein AB0B66_38340 [Catellatospora sp. NPDC049111]|uniref:hypothetical protein n=1 Tax=Catellatospora sp. NPDC049111 TaxID=3155271 RepID=UPI0033CF22BF